MDISNFEFVNEKYRGRDKIVREKISRAIPKFHVATASFEISIDEKFYLGIIRLCISARNTNLSHSLPRCARDVDLLYFHPSNQLLLSTLFPTLIDILHPICAICLQILLFRSIIRYRRTLDIKKTTEIIPTSPTCCVSGLLFIFLLHVLTFVHSIKFIYTYN